ncbi:S41 family peptidase [Aliikangiella maris]|uniref:S41 family peptidase n=2 Tax=Aliikangiella maris TaxID=3162458 RepID=A0ABV2BRG0_9GAMM
MTRYLPVFALLIILLLLSACVTRQPTSPLLDHQKKVLPPKADVSTLISPALLQEDITLLQKKILQIHPQPFIQVTESAFSAQFAALKQAINYPLSKMEFYLQVAPVVAQLGDIHSYIQLPSKTNEINSNSQHGIFPLAILVEQNQVFVAADLSDTPLIPAGAEIISINQAPIGYLLKTMRRLTARETEAGQNRRIQLDFPWLLAAMGHLSSEYSIGYRWQQKMYQQSLKAIVIAAKKEPVVTAIESYYGYSQLTDSTALLWLNDFNENPEKFDDYLTQQFALMQQDQVDNLIIDVRYNQGGLSENLKSLLSRMTDRPIRWANQGVLKLSKELKKHYVRKTKARREDKYGWGLQWLPLEWTDYLQHAIYWGERGELIPLSLEQVNPAENYRPSNIWVLTNGFCYSACSLFVVNVNHHQLAKTVGEETGSRANYQFAYPIEMTLPHSGLSLVLPAMRLEFNAVNNESANRPQLVIQRTVEQITQRIDPVLNHALREAEGVILSESGKTSK